MIIRNNTIVIPSKTKMVNDGQQNIFSDFSEQSCFKNIQIRIYSDVTSGPRRFYRQSSGDSLVKVLHPSNTPAEQPKQKCFKGKYDKKRFIYLFTNEFKEIYFLIRCKILRHIRKLVKLENLYVKLVSFYENSN